MEAPDQEGAAFDRMTLIEHIGELRSRLIKAVLAIAVFSIVGFVLFDQILDFIVGPYCDVRNGKECALVVIDPLEGFTTRIKVAAFVGIFLASPVVLWQVWRFVTPGLHKNEKRYAIPFVASSVILFVAGAIVAVLTFPKALEFLVNVGGPDLVPLFSPSKYLRLYMLVVFAFGISFEFPVLLVFLQLARVLDSKRLKQWRRGAIIGVFVLSAVITPSQDPVTLLALAVPMVIFYEIAIIIGRLLKR